MTGWVSRTAGAESTPPGTRWAWCRWLGAHGPSPAHRMCQEKGCASGMLAIKAFVDRGSLTAHTHNSTSTQRCSRLRTVPLPLPFSPPIPYPPPNTQSRHPPEPTFLAPPAAAAVAPNAPAPLPLVLPRLEPTKPSPAQPVTVPREPTTLPREVPVTAVAPAVPPCASGESSRCRYTQAWHSTSGWMRVSGSSWYRATYLRACVSRAGCAASCGSIGAVSASSRTPGSPQPSECRSETWLYS